jgi:cytochrome b561
MLCIGFFVLARTPNSEPQKIIILRVHMAVGVGILALMIIRFIVRLSTARPPHATTGQGALDRLAPLTHYGFYVLVLLMVSSGYATGLLAGLPAIVFGNSGDPLPASFESYPSMTAHFIIALLLIALIVLHALAACYHQFIRNDGLFRRMGFGRRV